MKQTSENLIRLPSGKLFLLASLCLAFAVFASDSRGADDPAQKNNAPAGNEEMLRGVCYDLKRTSDGMTTYLLELQGGKQFNRLRTWQLVWNLPDTAGSESVMVPFLKRFVLSNWPFRTDSAGELFYREFNQFMRSPITPYLSYFYQPNLPSDTAPDSFIPGTNFSDIGWVGIHSGYVVAPFTGKFRFVGYGNDALVVRFDKQLVLDYGTYALSIGKKLDDSWDYVGILSGSASRTDSLKRPLLENPIYSRCKLETYFPSLFDKHGIAKGVPISVTRGKHYPIEVLVTDIDHNSFCVALFIEYLDDDGNPLSKDPVKLPLFRTSSELPNHAGSSFPDFDENSPIWKVVDSNGKPIASLPQAGGTDNAAATKATDSKTDRKVTTKRQGNVSIQTVVETSKDLTIKTVTTTEEKGNATVQTKVVTETRNGVVEKKTTSTSDSVVIELFPDMPPEESVEEPVPAGKKEAMTESEKKTSTKTNVSGSTKSSSSGKETASSSTKKRPYNPFGYAQPPPEDE